MAGVDGNFEEVPLHGGNSVHGVVRVANTVRRRAFAWSPSIDALLHHLERGGFDGAPRALGYDQQGCQMVSYVEGYVDPDPSDLAVGRLWEVGALIRRFHDLADTCVVPPDATWNVAIAPDREELICHHDLAPWNLVRGGEQLVFIDWDGAGPGSRLWDLAYAVHGFVPLSASAAISDEMAASRLVALVDGYGLESPLRAELGAMLEPRILSMYELLRSGHESGAQPWSELWDQGHGSQWRADAAYTHQRLELWHRALSDI